MQNIAVDVKFFFIIIQNTAKQAIDLYYNSRSHTYNSNAAQSIEILLTKV